MSNQLQITGGAKVRNLNGVITGTTGVLGSVPLGAANGVATLDSSGKVPVSQLPASVVTYLGTWNAATNTPTLVNGTGDPGDLYICNVAGTVNFGAGPISFVVGDWVLYGSGTWQKSSGQNGTVTSVAVTETGDALTITGSPITTAGTINIGFAGTSAQYVAGNGSLITFPSLTGYVPYTGATSDVDLGTFKLNAQSLHVKGTAGSGHLGLKHQTSAASASASESSLFANVNGDLAWKNDNLYLSTFATYANTADRVYTFPDASGTLALTSDLSSYVTLAGTQTISGTKTFTATTTTSKIRVDNTLLSEGTTVAFKQYASGALGETGYTSLAAQGSDLFYINWGGTKAAILNSANLSTYRTYTLPNADGTLALTSDIPSLSGYVTLATTQTISGAKTFTSLLSVNNKIYLKTDAGSTGVYLQSYSSNEFSIGATSGATTYYSSFILQYATRSYTFPNADGTIALTSQLTGGTVTSVGLSSSTSGVTISSSPVTTSGTITLNIATASGSQQGLLSSTDWTTFNNKQNALTNPVTGTGTSNYLTKFTGTSTIGNSTIVDDGSAVSAYTNAFRVFQIGGSGAAFYLSGNSTQATMSAITSAGAYQDLAISGATLTFFSGTLGSLGSSLAMTINPSGNVSIGNSNNTYKLDVSGTGRFTSRLFVDGNLSGNNISFLKNTSSTGYGLSIQGGTSSNYALYIADYAGTQIFQMLGSGAATFSSSVTAGGYLANGSTTITSPIDTTSTKAYFDASSISGAALTLRADSVGRTLRITSDGSGTVIGAFDANSSGVNIGANTAHSLLFNTSGSERMRITSAGNVGIGTTSPAYKLDLFDVNGTFSQFYQNDGTYNRRLIITANATGGDAGITMNATSSVGGDSFIFKTASAERMRISGANGYLGIGTTTPGAPLSFADTTGNKIQFNANAGNFYGFGKEAAIVSGSDGAVTIKAGGLSYAKGDIGFYNGTSLGMVLSYNGYLGIGTSSPASILEIAATGPTLRINSTTGGNDGILAWYVNTNYIGDIRTNSGSGAMTFNQGPSAGWGGYMVFKTDTSERMRITSGGNLLVGTTADSGGRMRLNGDLYLLSQNSGAGSATLKYNLSTGQVTYDTSARHLKKDIEDLSYGLTDILKMSSKKYKYILDNTDDIGFIADEMYQIIPEVVGLSNNAINQSDLEDGMPISIKYDRIVPILVKAIQELKAEIDELKNK